MGQVSTGEMGAVGAVLVTLVGLIVWFWKSVIPWMKGRIDEKNGQISKLVGQTEEMVKQNRETVDNMSKLTRTIVEAVGRMGTEQEKFLCELRNENGKAGERHYKLMERIEEALER